MATDASTFADYLNNYLKDITNIINGQSNSVNSVLDKLQNVSLVEVNDLTNTLNKQNQQIDKQIVKVYSSTNGVKEINNKYEDAELKLIRDNNYILLIIYFIFVGFFAFILFYFRQSTLYINIGILAVLIGYPFYIMYIEKIFYTICKLIYHFIIGNSLTSNVYIQGDY